MVFIFLQETNVFVKVVLALVNGDLYRKLGIHVAMADWPELEPATVGSNHCTDINPSFNPNVYT